MAAMAAILIIAAHLRHIPEVRCTSVLSSLRGESDAKQRGG
jgi:hypothetical protein